MRRRNRHIYNNLLLKNGTIVPLASLAVGVKARVVAIRCRCPRLRRRMLDMGITAGAVVAVKRIAPFGDPVELIVRDYQLCLRRRDLSGIMVEVLS